MYFSKTLTGYAKAKRLGYEKLAYRADLSPVFVWRLMDGQKNPSYLTVYRLAKALSGEAMDGDILASLLMAALKDAVAKSR